MMRVDRAEINAMNIKITPAFEPTRVTGAVKTSLHVMVAENGSIEW